MMFHMFLYAIICYEEYIWRVLCYVQRTKERKETSGGAEKRSGVSPGAKRSEMSERVRLLQVAERVREEERTREEKEKE